MGTNELVVPAFLLYKSKMYLLCNRLENYFLFTDQISCVGGISYISQSGEDSWLFQHCSSV